MSGRSQGMENSCYCNGKLCSHSIHRKLRTLRLASCHSLTDKAFPSPVLGDNLISSRTDDEKPLPHRPITCLEILPPLILPQKAENLRVLDLTACNITDDAVEGIVSHASRIQTLILTSCTQLTDRALESIARFGSHLDVLILAYVSNITDRGLVKLARECTNLRCVDVACKFCCFSNWFLNPRQLDIDILPPLSLSKFDRYVSFRACWTW